MDKLVQSDQQSHMLLASLDQYSKVVAAMDSELVRVHQQHSHALDNNVANIRRLES
jgi:hypothetical protein